MSRSVASIVRPLVGAVVSLAAVFVALTYLALEGQEVAVIQTRGADGTPRTTRVWVADEGGSAWIEAGNAEREFYGDILREPRVALDRGGRTATYVAIPVPGAAAHRKIRGLLRDKYGFADWWIGVLVDTSGSIAVRLEAAAPPGAEPATEG